MKNTILIFVCLLGFGSLNAQVFKTQSVSIFKNGTAFFRKSGSVDVKNGQALFSNLEIASDAKNDGQSLSSLWENQINEVLFGSLWFHSPGNIISSTSRYDQVTQEERNILELKELIRENGGKSAVFTLAGYAEPIAATGYSAEGNVIVIESKGKWITAKLEDVRNVEFSQKPVVKAAMESRKRFIRLEFEKDQSAQPLDLMYMQRGISWIPNYLLEIDGNGKANVVLRASVMNDIEDLKDVEMNFVVGVPNFEHSSTPSPITSNQSVALFMNSLAGASGNNSNEYRNMMNVQSMSNYDNEANYGSQSRLDFVPEGSTQENLYFYNRKKVTLPKNGRAFYDLLRIETEYQQLYSCTLPAGIGYADPKNHEVWSTLRVKNNSGKPFTTGSVFVSKVQNGVNSPISETQLNFTPAGLYSQVKTTIAPDISLVYSEEEINRSNSQHKYRVLVEIKGTIEITNLKDKAIDLIIDKNITGFLGQTDLDWDAVSRFPSAGAINKENSVKWELKVESGGKKTITYQYKTHVNQ